MPKELLMASNSPHLDVELLLMQVLDKPRVYLYSHPEKTLSEKEWQAFNVLLKRCLDGEPIAYITGHKEFWSLDLLVNEKVLVPRPETELLVELALKKFPDSEAISCADLGTGSGAIALALASERPNWSILATDKSRAALSLARINAGRLGIDNVKFRQGSWCQALQGKRYDLIISNPPYIAEHDPSLRGSIKFEPKQALISGADGLDDINIIIKEAGKNLNSHGFLLLEHGYDQADKVSAIMHQQGYIEIATHKDLAGHDRVTEGRWVKNESVNSG